jgi:hypothetical protein
MPRLPPHPEFGQDCLRIALHPSDALPRCLSVADLGGAPGLEHIGEFIVELGWRPHSFEVRAFVAGGTRPDDVAIAERLVIRMRAIRFPPTFVRFVRTSLRLVVWPS